MTEDYFIRNCWKKVDIRDGFDDAEETFYFYTLTIEGAGEFLYSSDNLDSEKNGEWCVTFDCTGFTSIDITDEKKLDALINAIEDILL